MGNFKGETTCTFGVSDASWFAGPLGIGAEATTGTAKGFTWPLLSGLKLLPLAFPNGGPE